jgi:hypothetical protein
MASKKAITFDAARERLADEVDLLGAKSVVLSTNLELRANGAPKASQMPPADPGAAVYFRLRDRDMVLACDRWTSVAANVAAIAAHVGAMRGMARWGVGSIDQAFDGYLRLPPPDDWRALLGNPRTREEAEAAFRERMRQAHPDAGGSQDAAAALNLAIERARKELP